MKFHKPLLISVLALLLFVNGCANDGLTRGEHMRQTAYAMTIQAIQDSISQVTPTVAPTLDLGPTQTVLALTPALPSSTPLATAVSGSYIAKDVVDITVPDGSIYQPGDVFTKTWQITNGGTGTWSPNFKLVYVSGDDLSAPQYVYLNQTVSPGQNIQVSVDLTTPANDGTYTSYFMLQADNGSNFGIGGGTEPFWVSIIVASGFQVLSATVDANPSTYTGTCPVSIKLHATFRVSSAGTVIFHYVTSDGEVAAEPVIFTEAGQQTSTGTKIEVSQTEELTVYIYVDDPNGQAFDPIVISVTCE